MCVCGGGGGGGGGVFNNAIILRMITCGQSSYVEIGFGLSVQQHCHSTFSETSGLCKKKKNLLKETKTTKTIHLANISPFKYSSLLLNKKCYFPGSLFFCFFLISIFLYLLLH